jgi:sec-independent protein translocase protein TatB
MLDIGWPELFVIAVVTIVVVGPKELPRVVRGVNAGLRKIRGLAREFQGALDEMAREADVADIRREIEKAGRMDLAASAREAVDPTGTIDGAFDYRLPEYPAPMDGAPADGASADATSADATSADGVPARGDDTPRAATCDPEKAGRAGTGDVEPSPANSPATGSQATEPSVPRSPSGT